MIVLVALVLYFVRFIEFIIVTFNVVCWAHYHVPVNGRPPGCPTGPAGPPYSEGMTLWPSAGTPVPQGTSLRPSAEPPSSHGMPGQIKSNRTLSINLFIIQILHLSALQVKMTTHK